MTEASSVPQTRPILALDTGSRWCAAAVRRADGQVFEAAEPIGRGHAERLAPMVQALLGEAGIAPADLARIVAATGPGSFAGTRVGTAFARGLALATGAQAVGVSNLDALARRADPKGVLTVAAIHDARRGELVVQVFTHGVPVTGPDLYSVSDALDELALYGDVHLTGSGAALLGADPAHHDERPSLAELLDLGEAAPLDAPPPSPLYARPPDAKLPGGLEPA